MTLRKVTHLGRQSLLQRSLHAKAWHALGAGSYMQHPQPRPSALAATTAPTPDAPLNPAAVLTALRRLNILLLGVRELAPGAEAVPEVIKRRHLRPRHVRAADVGHIRVDAPARVAAERGRKDLGQEGGGIERQGVGPAMECNSSGSGRGWLQQEQLHSTAANSPPGLRLPGPCTP
jgi:hypothetical protein